MNNSCTAFMDLPDDAILNIMMHLSSYDVTALACCNKNLNRVVENDDLWFILLKKKWGKYCPGIQQVWVSHACSGGQTSVKGLLIPDWMEGQLRINCTCMIKELPGNHKRSLDEPPVKVSMSGSKICNCPSYNHVRPGSLPNLAIYNPIAISSRDLFNLIENGTIEFPVQILTCEVYLDCLLSAYDGRARMKEKTRQNGVVKDVFEVSYNDSMEELSIDEVAFQEEVIGSDRFRPSPVAVHPKQVYGGCDIRHLAVGDFVEVQWRSQPDLPFTWFFGQVRHFLFCPVATSLDKIVPECKDCVCNQMRRVCVTFRKFGFDYVERSLFVDKETPSLHRQIQAVGFSGTGSFGGIRKIQKPAEVEAWLNCGKSFQSLERKPSK